MTFRAIRRLAVTAVAVGTLATVVAPAAAHADTKLRRDTFVAGPRVLLRQRLLDAAVQLGVGHGVLRRPVALELGPFVPRVLPSRLRRSRCRLRRRDRLRSDQRRCRQHDHDGSLDHRLQVPRRSDHVVRPVHPLVRAGGARDVRRRCDDLPQHRSGIRVVAVRRLARGPRPANLRDSTQQLSTPDSTTSHDGGSGACTPEPLSRDQRVLCFPDAPRGVPVHGTPVSRTCGRGDPPTENKGPLQ